MGVASGAGTETGSPASAASGDASTAVPVANILSSLKQAFQHDYEHDVVAGHFDVGSPPDAHRYYCLVDEKTGMRQPSAVGGRPVRRSDGMTRIEGAAVAFYSCGSAEQQGILVTTGYMVPARTGAMVAPASPVPKPERSANVAEGSPGNVDVAGVKLGMSLDEVRAVLKSKKLLAYYELTETLDRADPSKGTTQPMVDGRFVNVVAAWTPAPSSPVAEDFGWDGESYEVMFTPLPGGERAMAIVHSAAYAPASAVREIALENALVKKYGGFDGSHDLPESPTWRIQSSGTVLVGDACNRRGLFGGLGGSSLKNVSRQNLALRTTPEEFRFQIDHCGVAIVTEDHSTANAAASREDRDVKRVTVTAYSPSIGSEGAAMAAQLIRTTGDAGNARRTKEQPAPNL